MKENKLGQEPAFAVADLSGEMPFYESGISKRFYAACAALTGIMANSNPNFIRMDFETAVVRAYICADELLKQENE